LNDDSETSPIDTAPEKEVTIDEKIPEDIDWENYIEEYNSPGRTSYESEDKDTPRFENFIAHKESLSEHLLWQLLMLSPTEEEQKIGNLIVGNLNKDGYLETSVEDLAEVCGSTPDKVKEVLTLLQTFDPIGICARDLSECLLIQANHLGLKDTIVTDIIKNHLNHLENKNYKTISSTLKISLNDVISAVNVIKELEPKPGRQFTGEETQYITPDIYVYKFEDDFVIVLNDDGMPKLRVNSFYKKALSRNDQFSKQTKDYVQDKLRSATWLIRSIHGLFTIPKFGGVKSHFLQIRFREVSTAVNFPHNLLTAGLIQLQAINLNSLQY